MKGYIYKIENELNNKCYIGQTKNQKGYIERWKQHIKSSEKMINNKLYNAIRKYGIDNFKFEIIECVELNFYNDCILDELEIKYVTKYDSYRNGYNSTLGGQNVAVNFTGFRKIENKVNKLKEEFYKNKYNKKIINLNKISFNDMCELYDEFGMTNNEYRWYSSNTINNDTLFNDICTINNKELDFEYDEYDRYFFKKRQHELYSYSINEYYSEPLS